MTDYEKDTLDAYRTKERASSYKSYQSSEWSWGRLMTWLEQRAVAGELRRYQWRPEDQLLDIPCGTGILGKILHEFPFKIAASDISPEMMELAVAEYPKDRFLGCTRADITKTPFARGSFSCVVTLGFLHRVPPEVKQAALKEIASLSSRVVIVSCSVDTLMQRLKHQLFRTLRPSHVPAPCPATLADMVAECEKQGLCVVRARRTLPFLSSHALLVLEKR